MGNKTSQLREHMQAMTSSGRYRKTTEDIEDLEIETGIAASASLWLEGARYVSPSDVLAYFKSTNVVSQQDRGRYSVSLADVTSKFSLRAVTYSTKVADTLTFYKKRVGVQVLTNSGQRGSTGPAPLSIWVRHS